MISINPRKALKSVLDAVPKKLNLPIRDRAEGETLYYADWCLSRAAEWDWDAPYISVCVDRLHYPPKALGFTLDVGGEERDISITAFQAFIRTTVSINKALPWSFRKASYEWAERLCERIKQEGGETVYPYQLDPMDGRCVLGLNLNAEGIEARLWSSYNGWSSSSLSKAPWKGWGWSLSFLHPTHGSDTLEERPPVHARVTMPEGAYPVEVRIRKVQPYRKVAGIKLSKGHPFWVAQVEVQDGYIPYPSKDYASESDGLGAMSSQYNYEPNHFAPCVAAALSVLEYRAKRASVQWEPKGGWPSNMIPLEAGHEALS